jgi:hypothetical protein
LNVYGVNDVRQTEIHTAEPLVSEPSTFEFELAIEKLKSHPSPGIDQIPIELRQGVEEFTMRSITYYFYLEKRGIA